MIDRPSLRNSLRWALIASVALAAPACEDTPEPPNDVPVFQDTVPFPDAGDAAPSVDGDAADMDGDSDVLLDVMDGTEPDGDAPDGEVSDIQDVAVSDLWDGTPPVDTSFDSLIPDSTHPTVISVSPDEGAADIAMPFTVTITFSEGIAINTIAPQTVKVLDVENKEIPGERVLSEDKTTVVFTPSTDAKMRPASPYRVVVIGGIVSDLAGNKLQETWESQFYTAGFEGMAVYETLAQTYAPTVQLSTMEGSPNAHIPLAFDADGDWDGGNNRASLLKAKTLSPALYYNVTETPSHWFIHYAYHFPWVNHPVSGYAHANGVSGVMITVQKAVGEQAERPIAATTYYKEKLAEENDTFVTTESGLVGGSSASFYGIKAVFSQAELFPGGHFENYISPLEHESCAWVHTGENLNCKLIASQKESMVRFTLRYAAGVPTLVQKNPSWPVGQSEVTVEGEEGPVALESLDYALIATVDTLWPRRTDIGFKAPYQTTYNYSPAPGNVGAGAKFPSKFNDELDDGDFSFGRPIWAWDFKPGFGSPKGVKTGWFGVDPAYYLWKRHASTTGDTALVDFDPEAKTGFALSYCFNVFAGIDKRATDPLCGAVIEGE